MTFATWPIALIAAAVAVPALVILYFLKLRRRDLEISSTLLWKKAVQDLQANAPFQRLRNNILLVLQLLALLLALFALAQPEIRLRGTANARHIILIDRSASMSALDGDGKPPAPPAAGAPAPDPAKAITRLDAAKKAARALVDGLRERSFFDDSAEEAMVIAFDSSATVLQSFTASKADLRRAIDAVTPTDAPGALARAYELARAYAGTRKFEDQVKEGGEGRPGGFVASGPGAAIHLISDGRLPDADKVQTAPEDVVFFQSVGSEDAPNVAITGLRAERAFDNPSRVNIFCGLQSTDPVAQTVDVELVVDGVRSAVKDVKVGAATQPVGIDATADRDSTTTPGPDAPKPDKPRARPGVGGFVLPLDRAGAGVATVRITPSRPDALPVDNVAYLAIPPARRMAVVLVTTGNAAVERALEGMRLSRFDVRTPEQFQKLLDDGQLAQYDVFVLDRWLPDVRPPAPAAPGPPGAKPGPGLPPGRSLVLGAVPPPPLGAVDEGKGDEGVIVNYQRDHPALALSGLDRVSLFETRKVRLPADSPAKVLASGVDGPAILETSDAQTYALILTFDPLRTNWFVSEGWVVFLGSAVIHLAQANSGTLAEGARVGETLTSRLPPGATRVTLAAPEGVEPATVALEPSADSTVSFGPLQRCGIYTLRWTGQATATDTAEGDRAARAIPANLLDPYESDVGAVTTLPMAREVVRAAEGKQSDLVRRLWPWALLAALAVVMLEWYVYNRKVAI